MWAKEGAVFFQCPESLLTGEIIYWLSLESILRDQPNVPWLDLPAVDCDVLQLLWQEKGNANGNQ